MRYFVFIFLCFPILSIAQSKRAVSLFEKGLSYEKQRNYSEAKACYLKALEKEPDYVDPIFQLGAIAYDSQNFEEAYTYLGKALKLNPALLSKVGYQLGRSALKSNHLEEAKDILNNYLTTSKNSSLKTKASDLIEKVNFRLNTKSDFTFKPVNLGPAINSRHPENGPSLTADGQTIVFTRETGRQEDLWMAHKNNGAWQPAFLVPNVNTEQWNEGAQCISPDGTVLAFIACDRKDGYGGCDIYWSEYIDGAWSKPKNLDYPVNDRGRETQPTIAPDNKSMIFASDREGGYGKLDLYITKRQPDGSWSKPENLGPTINTASDDRTPFWHPDGKTLYFSSKGHMGFGGFDLFRVQRQEDGSWGNPKNMGTPLNTEGNEGSLMVSLDGSTGYYTTNQGETLGATDVFSFEMPPALRPDPVTFVRAKVIDAETKKTLEAMVLVKNLDDVDAESMELATRGGSFLVCLPIGATYGMQVSKPGYAFKSQHFDLVEHTDGKPFEVVLALIPISENVPTEIVSKPIVLENIFFESGSAKLTDQSIPELMQLKKFLDDNPTRKIEIRGHTDNVGGESDNLKLSKDRAQAVVAFLTEAGIAANRLSSQGFGESAPIASNDTADGRRLNRRTEFVVK